MVSFNAPGSLVRDLSARCIPRPQLIDALDGAFAVGGAFADDQGAAIILKRAGENLGGGGAAVAGEDHEGAVIRHEGVGVVGFAHGAVHFFDLDDGAGADEQAGELDGFFEGAAAVAAQVQNDAGDVFLFEFLEQGTTSVVVLFGSGLSLEAEVSNVDVA